MDSSSVSNSRLLMIILKIKSYQNLMNLLEAKSIAYIKQGKGTPINWHEGKKKKHEKSAKRYSFFRMFKNTPKLAKGTIETNIERGRER